MKSGKQWFFALTSLYRFVLYNTCYAKGNENAWQTLTELHCISYSDPREQLVGGHCFYVKAFKYAATVLKYIMNNNDNHVTFKRLVYSY